MTSSKKRSTDLAQAGDLIECAIVVAAALFGLDAGGGFPAGLEEFAFGVVLEEFWVDGGGAFEIRFLENLADALEGDGERLEVLGLADGFQGFEAALRVDEIVDAAAEDGVDLVVGEAVLFAEDVLGAIENEIESLSFLRCR